MLSKCWRFFCMYICKFGVQIKCNLTIMYVYCAYPAISSSPTQLPNCLKIVEISVILIIVFNGVIFDVSAYNSIVSFCRSTWIMYQKWFIRIYSLKLNKWIYWRNIGFYSNSRSLYMYWLKAWRVVSLIVYKS
jgi:hypothetical protein